MGIAEFAAAGRLTEAGEKALLITEALDALRLAEQLDERESLNSTSWVAWYDATIPRVQDIKILAGAMEIELGRRRGEQIQAEGERRGRPPNKVTHRVMNSVAMNSAYTTRRERDRALAAEPEKVTAYIQQEAAAGRVPSVRGAVRAAKANTEKGASPIESTPDSRHTAALTRITRAHQRLFDRIARVSGTPRTASDLGGCLGLESAATQRFLHDAALLPWVRIERSGETYTFRIDNALRERCALSGSRPDLPGGSVAAFLDNLRREIVRRREENKDNRLKRRWTAEGISQVEQSHLLDWIEAQLDVVSKARISGRKDKSSA